MAQKFEEKTHSLPYTPQGVSGLWGGWVDVGFAAAAAAANGQAAVAAADNPMTGFYSANEISGTGLVSGRDSGALLYAYI
jgi:hypothetical protein